MWTCKYCKKEFNFNRATEKANHTKHCKDNPKRFETYKNIRTSLNKRADQSLGELTDFKVNCRKCGKVFSVTERKKRFPSKEKYFCSRNCSNSEGGKTKSSLYHGDNVATYSTVCFRYHQKKCVVCGENKIVAVHHYNEDHNDNRPENLVPLCPTHHHYIHSRYKHEIIDIVDRYVENFKEGAIIQLGE